MIRDRSSQEEGFATVAHVAAAGLALYLFALLANLIVLQYSAGVVRSAVEEGAARGAVAGAGEAECLARMSEVLEGLLGGSASRRVEGGCSVEEGVVRAAAGVTVAGLVPPVPTLTFRHESEAVREEG